jgi:hypothetical protein
MAVCSVWLWSSALFAQGSGTAGQFPIRKPNGIVWERMESADCTVEGPDDSRFLTEATLRLAQRSYLEFSRKLEYQTSLPLCLRVYPGLTAYTNANLNDPDGYYFVKHNPTGLGALYFDGTLPGLQRRVRHEVVRLILDDMFHSSRRNTFQNQLLLYLPPWYLPSLADYLANDWTETDEASLVNLIDELRPPATDSLSATVKTYTFEWEAAATRLLAQPYNPRYAVLYKTLWHYVAVKFGTRKLSEVVYMTRLTRSIDNGFGSVTGAGLQGMLKPWGEFCEQLVGHSFQGSIWRDARLLHLTRENEQLVGAAIHGLEVAYIVHREGRHTLNIFHGRRKTISRNIVSWNVPQRQADFETTTYPMAWSPNGTELVACVTRNGRLMALYYSVFSGKISWLSLDAQFDGVQSISWSPDGKSIALSAWRNGQVDIFVGSPMSTTFKAITRDPYPDTDVSWAPGGRSLYFASTRDTALNVKYRTLPWRALDQQTDIYRADSVRSGKPQLKRLTQTPLTAETLPRPHLLSGALHYLTDTTGQLNLAEDQGSEPARLLTNYIEGLHGYAFDSTRVLYWAWHLGQRALFLRTADAPSFGLRIQLTLRARARQQAILERINRLTTLKLIPAETPVARPQPRPDAPDVEPEDDDTTATNSPPDSTRQRSRFYVFDEDDDKPAPKAQRNPLGSRNRLNRRTEVDGPADERQPLEPDLASIKLILADKVPAQLLNKYFRYWVGVDPLFRFFVQGQLRLESPDKRHQVTLFYKPYIEITSRRPFVVVNSQETGLAYAFQGNGFGLRYEGGFKSWYFERPLDRFREFAQPQGYQYEMVHNRVALTLPLNQFQGFELSTTNRFYALRDLRTFDDDSLDNHGWAQSIEAAWQFDNTRSREGFITRGVSFRSSLGRTFLLNQLDSSYYHSAVDLKCYIPLPRDARLYLGGQARANWGGREQSYLIGGIPNWAGNHSFTNELLLPVGRGYGYEQMGNAEFLMPIRGVANNARTGRYAAIFNAELCLPLNRVFARKVFATAPQYTLQWLFFYDAGVSWRTGNPFSQQNPIDATTIIRYPLSVNVQTLKSPYISGFGTGLQTSILGYALRADLAWGVEESTLSKPQFLFSFWKKW